MLESSRTKFDYVRGYTSFVSNSWFQRQSVPPQIDINCFIYSCCCLSPLSLSLSFSSPRFVLTDVGASLKQFMRSIKLLLKMTKAWKSFGFFVFNFHKFHLNVFHFFDDQRGGRCGRLYQFYNSKFVRLMCQVFFMKMITRFYDD